ncbi:NADPH-dependent glutamate synthase [Gorillibacterium massiliense]|uniref:NADPH-dependent glutamate synthase n=1 Tax=Gorillibacterium massiliense TaxID=1280390 RepID=UPI0004B4CEBA|nr:NADPH-dependent glutamate synthase [Gorillibacterium massiliense]
MGRPNMTRNAMPEQPPLLRSHNFDEVALGYTLWQAMDEARRCLHCRNQPCVDGCPVGVPIPDFLQAMGQGRMERAYEIITSENNLPAICGRVCPQESQCEALCVRGKKGEAVAIGRLERFAADYALLAGCPDPRTAMKNGDKVAVVGGGPAGLTCAGDLAKLGYDVTIFEALHALGGVLLYGIPEFRLPKDLVQEEIEKIASMGVHIERNVVVGRSITIDELQEEGFKAIFVGSGAGLPRFMNIEGENLNGVYSANEFLTRVNLMGAYNYPRNPTPVKVGRRVAVVGGGNVAMDAARTALRLGAEEVSIVYRRGFEELPARQEEVHHAMEEGVRFRLLTNPVKIGGENGWVKAMDCVEMELGEPDASGRRSPVEKLDSRFTLDVETVIIAIGQGPNPLIRQTTPGLSTERWGGIVVQEDSMQTSKPDVYAGGDAVTGAATVILAMGAGKKAAKAIHESLQSKRRAL